MQAFAHTEVLIGMRGSSAETSLFFDVGERGRLHKVQVESKIVASYMLQRVRVLGVLGRR